MTQDFCAAILASLITYSNALSRALRPHEAGVDLAAQAARCALAMSQRAPRRRLVLAIGRSETATSHLEAARAHPKRAVE